MKSASQAYRYIIKNDACQFDLQQTFNQLSMFTLNPPQIPTVQNNRETLPPISVSINKAEVSINKTDDDKEKQNLIQVLGDIKGLKNVLRYIRLDQRQVQKKKTETVQKSKAEGQTKQVPIDKQLFIRPTQTIINGNKTFWLIRGLKQSSRQKLNLDSPTFVITFNTEDPTSNEGEQLLVAIQRKCLTLYQVDESQVQLKDFDSVSLDKKLNIVEIKHVQHEGKNFVLIFGNQKQKKQFYFKCMVYEVKREQFIFIKKATLWKGEVLTPTILFDNYPKNEMEKYCLIVGGCQNTNNTNHYRALQVDIHLLVTHWLIYPIELTRQVPFDTQRQSIFSGKAIKYNDFWYIFCTQNQTITQLKMDYQHGIWLQTLHLSTVQLELKQKIYFSENNLFLTLKGALKLIMLNVDLQFREKDFLEIVERFDNH